MSYATAAPGQSSIPNAGPPTCANCTTLTTPLWRRDEDGNVLCNACGLFLKLHGKPRPISLKTDTIKSRNRVKASGQPRKKEFLPAAHPASGQAPQNGRQGEFVQDPSGRGEAFRGYEKTGQGVNVNGGSGNIAPQHMFDGATLGDAAAAAAGSLTNIFYNGPPPELGQASTSPSMTTAGQHNQFDTHLSYEELRDSTATLQTRVSELELINSMFRERCTQLEEVEREAKEREKELLSRIEALEGRKGGGEDLPRKRERFENAEREIVVDPNMGAAAKGALDALAGGGHGQK